jgi:glucan phosphorylase
MVIGHTKRISVHKRHILSVIGIVDAWLRDDRRSFTVFAGKANPEHDEEKQIIRLILRVAALT